MNPAQTLRLVASAAIALLVIAAEQRVAADPIILIDSPGVVAPGSTGNAFDVFLQVDTPSTDMLDAFNVTLSFNGAPVTITGVSETGATPYVFPGVAGLDRLGLAFSVDPTTPTPSVDFNDLTFAPITLDSVGTFLLGRVTFDVDPTAAPGGAFALSIISPTSLSAPGGTPLDFTIADGELRIIPEPTSLLLAGLGLGSLGLWTARPRSRRSV